MLPDFVMCWILKLMPTGFSINDQIILFPINIIIQLPRKKLFILYASDVLSFRCKCNGHAQECYLGQGPAPDFERREQCRCRHNTDGANCEKCLPMYNDKPWARATETSAYECKRKLLGGYFTCQSQYNGKGGGGINPF